MLVAGRDMDVNGETRVYLDPVPEAIDWPNLRAFLSAGKLLDLQPDDYRFTLEAKRKDELRATLEKRLLEQLRAGAEPKDIERTIGELVVTVPLEHRARARDALALLVGHSKANIEQVLAQLPADAAVADALGAIAATKAAADALLAEQPQQSGIDERTRHEMRVVVQDEIRQLVQGGKIAEARERFEAVYLDVVPAETRDLERKDFEEYLKSIEPTPPAPTTPSGEGERGSTEAPKVDTGAQLGVTPPEPTTPETTSVELVASAGAGAGDQLGTHAADAPAAPAVEVGTTSSREGAPAISDRGDAVAPSSSGAKTGRGRGRGGR